jgi:hypothetical protein
VIVLLVVVVFFISFLVKVPRLLEEKIEVEKERNEKLDELIRVIRSKNNGGDI